MGYRGKVEGQARAVELRAAGATVPDIAARLGVARSSVSRWVRHVPFTPGPRPSGADHPRARARAALAAGAQRRFFAVDEARLRVRLYLHEGLDLVAATHFWSGLTGIPVTQFTRPYRAVADASMRQARPDGLSEGALRLRGHPPPRHRAVRLLAIFDPSVRGSTIGSAAPC